MLSGDASTSPWNRTSPSRPASATATPLRSLVTSIPTKASLVSAMVRPPLVRRGSYHPGGRPERGVVGPHRSSPERTYGLTVRVRRRLACPCQGAAGVKSCTVLELGKDAPAPELAYVTARYAALAPFGKVAALLSYVDGHVAPTDFSFLGAVRREPSKPEARASPGVRGPLLGRASGEARPGAGHPDGYWDGPASRQEARVRVNGRSGPVRCALMSGLSRGRCRWPSWVCARVPGTNLSGALEAQPRVRYRLDCPDHSLSHHAVQRFLPDRPDSRPPPPVRRNVTPRLP